MRTLQWWNVVMLGLGCQAAVAAQAPVAIVGTTVVDVRAGQLLRNRTILIRDGRIVAIAGPDSVMIPAVVTRVDGAGTFAIPGLYDMHAHVQSRTDLELFLANGVSNVQVLNAHDGIVQWADSIASGRLRGPAIHACIGPISGIDLPRAAREVVARAASQGTRCLKPYDRITDSAYTALLEAARAARLRTVSHIPRNLTWQVVLAARPSALAHLEEFLYSPITSDQATDTILAALHRDGIAVITTLTGYDLITRQLLALPELMRDPRMAYISPVISRTWTPGRNKYQRNIQAQRLSSMRNLLTFQRNLARRIDSTGAQLLPGTDAGNNFVMPGWSLHDELEQLVTSGLTPARALRAATLDAARFLNDSLGGVVEAGRRADLVLIRGNPLTDITNTALIAGIVHRGAWAPRDTLQARLDQVALGYAAEHRFVTAADLGGVPAAIAATPPDQRPVMMSMNEFGYQYWRIDHDTVTARLVFEANTRWYPGEWVTHATLAEYFEETGNKGAARTSLGRALALAPTNRDLLDMQQRLR